MSNTTPQTKQTLEFQAEQSAGPLAAVIYSKEQFQHSLASSFMSEVVNDIFISEDRREHYKRLFYLYTAISGVDTVKTISKKKRSSN